MNNYFYNGIELPALPEWDKTAYPYSVLSYDRTEERYELHVSCNAIAYDDTSVVTSLSIKAPWKRSRLVDGKWSAFSDHSTDLSHTIIGMLGVILTDTIWCNADILKTDGSVYLAASEPVPVGGEIPETPEEPFDPSVEPYPYPYDELAIAFIYGEQGQLPTLPTYHRVGKPYALMFYVPSEWGGGVDLFYSDHPLVYITSKWWTPESSLCAGEQETKIVHYSYAYNFDDPPTKFTYQGDSTIKPNGYITGNTRNGDRRNVYWANYTVYNDYGQVECEPSMPIPVYAEPDIPDTPEPDVPEPEIPELPDMVEICAQNPEEWENQDFYDRVNDQWMKRDVYVRVSNGWIKKV